MKTFSTAFCFLPTLAHFSTSRLHISRKTEPGQRTMAYLNLGWPNSYAGLSVYNIAVSVIKSARGYFPFMLIGLFHIHAWLSHECSLTHQYFLQGQGQGELLYGWVFSGLVITWKALDVISIAVCVWKGNWVKGRRQAAHWRYTNKLLLSKWSADWHWNEGENESVTGWYGLNQVMYHSFIFIRHLSSSLITGRSGFSSS